MAIDSTATGTRIGPRPSSFRWQGRTLAYEEQGTGDQVVVLLHGLLLDARSNRATARRLADGGYRAASRVRRMRPATAAWAPM